MIWISSKLSGAFEGVLRAARAVESRNINFSYCMIDSSSCGFDEAFPVLAGIRSVKEGKTLTEVAHDVVESIKSTRFLFTPESLTFLQKGGRIGGAAALLGNLIKLSPVLTVVDGIPQQWLKFVLRKKPWKKLFLSWKKIEQRVVGLRILLCITLEKRRLRLPGTRGNRASLRKGS